MKIHGQLTAEDYAGALSMITRSLAVRALPLLLGMSVLPFFSGSRDLFTSAPLILFAALSAMMAFVIWGPAQLFLSRRFLAKKRIPGPRDLEITAEGVTNLGLTSPETRNWDTSFKYYQTNAKLILIIRSPARFQIFPRRWFTPEQLAEFESHLQKAFGTYRRDWS